MRELQAAKERMAVIKAGEDNEVKMNYGKS